MSRRVSGWTAVVVVAAMSSPACGESRFFFEDAVVFSGTTVHVPLKGDNECSLLGYSFGVDYDEAKLTVTRVTDEGTTVEGADFFAGTIHAANGLVGWGCVIDLLGGFAVIPPGVDRTLGVLVIDVAEVDEGTATTLEFDTVNVHGDPFSAIENNMTCVTDDGLDTLSVDPALYPGTLTISEAGPIIVGISNGCGSVGSLFQVTGENFDVGELEVSVGGEAASFSLRPDHATVDVEAPDVGLVGAVAVAVSTRDGQDVDPAGFTYEKQEPEITRVVNNAGAAGSEFRILGHHLAQRGSVVTVCGVPVLPDSVSDSALVVTAPPCPGNGWALVEICTPSLCGGEELCDARAEGFLYRSSSQRPVFRRGDANGDAAEGGLPDLADAVYVLSWLYASGIAPECADAADVDDSGEIDLTDAVHLLSWLFVGGGNPPPPAPGPGACGVDDTEDPGAPGGDLGCIFYKGEC